MSDDLLVFAEESDGDDSAADNEPLAPWRVLIVDDEEQIHAATTFALRDVRFAGRPVTFDSAYSAAEARELLAKDDGYACIFLDVVMETEHAGLELVPWIREQAANEAVRIILRTGQPGYAPEMEVIQRYDINDYKAKSELTRDRLLTTLITALRSYHQLKAIESSREGLQMILDASTSLFSVRHVSQFALGALKQICSLLQTPTEGILCAHYAGDSRQDLRVLAASGRFMGLQGKKLSETDVQMPARKIQSAIDNKSSRFDGSSTVLYIVSPLGDELAVYVDCSSNLSELDKRMIHLFSVNVAVGFENAHLFEHVERLAYIDQLTQLPNRVAFQREIERMISQGKPFAVVIADIDNFQAVNDGLGHEVGDATLNLAAKLINRHFGGKHFVSRISSDSFGIVVPAPSSEMVVKTLDRFQAINDSVLHVRDNQVPLSTTFGVALFPVHETQAEALFKCAGIALKAAKGLRRGTYKIFDVSMEKRLKHRLSLINELRNAAPQEQFSLLFQPVIRVETRQILGCEALIRWIQGDRIVMPDEFIPAAEESGQIIRIGAWVLEAVCKQLAEWGEVAHGLRMAVNVSTRQLRDTDFLDLLKSLLLKYRIPPSALELELTESFLIEDLFLARERLQEIRALGVGLAIDDFGTGYSSLSYLHELPVDRLKIDRSFVHNMGESSQDRTICDLIVQTGQLLGMTVLAEGVENEVQASLLKEIGCQEAQGFLFGRPMRADKIFDLLNPSREE